MTKLILASGSRYRKMLLQRLGREFTVQAPDVDESPLPGETPQELAVRLALAKCERVASRFPNAIVIGSDQVANLNGRTLGKPGNHERATAQLQAMSGQTVFFLTCVAVQHQAKGFAEHRLVEVKVRFRNLGAPEIERYLQQEQPYDCAGSARSEGLGISLLESIQSDDPTALIGLPLIATSEMLRAAGLQLP